MSGAVRGVAEDMDRQIVQVGETTFLKISIFLTVTLTLSTAAELASLS